MKYELTEETKVVNGHTLHRIRAVKNILTVENIVEIKMGALGGWVESERNLSQYGSCWVYHNACVFSSARVHGDASVYDGAHVYDNACMFGNACVFEDAHVYGNAKLYDNARVGGNAHVHGFADIRSEMHILANAYIGSNDDFYAIQNVGSRDDDTTFFKTTSGGIYVCCGCFNGTLEKFLKKVEKTHGDNKHGRIYKLAAEIAKIKLSSVE